MSVAEQYATAAADYDTGDVAWILAATVFVWPIIPGIGLLYSGYTNRRNSLATVWTSLCVLSVSSISWMLLGYSLAYAPGGSFIGGAKYFGAKGVMHEAVGTLPEMLYFIFQMMFCAATVAIWAGGAAERARLSCMPFLAFFWPLVVYCFVCHWTWAGTGWLNALGALDFAGGSPVHIASGAGAAAFGFYLSNPLFRSRKNASRSLRVLVSHRPHNLLQLSLAVILIWSGWLAFDGGSTLALNLRAAVAMTTTHLSGCMGAATWSLWHFWETKHWSLSAFVSGAIAGLVTITPGCGFVGLPASLLFGFVGATACFWFCKVKNTAFARRIGYFDPCDVTGCHWFGGVIGNCLTGIFAQASIAATDGASEIAGGWLDGNFRQLGIQIADCCAATLWAFVITYLLVAICDCIPGLEVLATSDDITRGIDWHTGESYNESQWMDEDSKDPFGTDGSTTPTKDMEKQIETSARAEPVA